MKPSTAVASRPGKGDGARSSEAGAVPRKPRRPRASRASRAGAVPYAFLTPAIVLFVLFFALPIAYTGYLSLRRIKVSGLGLGRGSRREVFVGLANYHDAVTDPEFWHSWLRVLGYGTVVLVVMLGLALVFALILDSSVVRLARFGRIAIFLPYAVPGVIASLMWGFLYLPSLSPLQLVFRTIGIGDVDLLDPSVLTFSLANIAVWGGTGFNMLVLYTALRATPREYYEAARIDGAGELQVALRIKLPILRPAIILTT